MFGFRVQLSAVGNLRRICPGLVRKLTLAAQQPHNHAGHRSFCAHAWRSDRRSGGRIANPPHDDRKSCLRFCIRPHSKNGRNVHKGPPLLLWAGYFHLHSTDARRRTASSHHRYYAEQTFYRRSDPRCCWTPTIRCILQVFNHTKSIFAHGVDFPLLEIQLSRMAKLGNYGPLRDTRTFCYIKIFPSTRTRAHLRTTVPLVDRRRWANLHGFHRSLRDIGDRHCTYSRETEPSLACSTAAQKKRKQDVSCAARSGQDHAAGRMRDT